MLLRSFGAWTRRRRGDVGTDERWSADAAAMTRRVSMLAHAWSDHQTAVVGLLGDEKLQATRAPDLGSVQTNGALQRQGES